MKKIDLGQTIGILANLGVIAGIAFLAIEVNQNQASQEQANALELANTSLGVFQNFRDFREKLMLDEQLAEIWSSGLAGEELSESDDQQFGLLCQDLTWSFVLSYERLVLLGEDMRALSGPVKSFRSELEASRMRRCWDQMKQGVRDWGYSSFVDAVDRPDF